MPNFDGGHYFLTALIPIRTDLIELDGLRNSPVYLVRESLSLLPPAMQSKAAEEIGLNSPFAKNLRTHFTRFAVIDDVSWNGRVPVNPLVVAAKGLNPVVGGAYDELTCPFLLWAVDFDAASGEAKELESYLIDLWKDAGDDLRRVFTYCVGFDAKGDGRAFASYIAKCQIETTMPFNDYWIDPPPFVTASAKALALPVVAVGLAALVAIGLAIWNGTPWYWVVGLIVLGLVAIAASVYCVYRYALQKGETPFPTAPHSDLRSVLKALYLQQNFTRFVIATQGRDSTSLHAEFGRFLQRHKPLDVAGPTQPAGVIRS